MTEREENYSRDMYEYGAMSQPKRHPSPHQREPLPPTPDADTTIYNLQSTTPIGQLVSARAERLYSRATGPHHALPWGVGTSMIRTVEANRETCVTGS